MKETTNLDRLKMAVRKLKNEEEYKKFLKFSNKFYGEDYKNQLLIYLQFPEATKVNTFSNWKKEGRNVKKNPRKIYLYGCYRHKKETSLEGQIDIKGNENKTRKMTIEYFNGLPYRKTCNYDIVDTFLDKSSKVAANVIKLENNYSEQDFMDCLKREMSLNIIEYKDIPKTTSNKEIIEIYSILTLYQNISLVIREMSHLISKKKTEFENKLLENMAGETIGFLIADYFGFDTSIYQFLGFYEFNRQSLETKVDFGTFCQREAKEIINIISKRMENKAQICA